MNLLPSNLKRLTLAIITGVGILLPGCARKQFSWSTEAEYYKLPIWKQHVKTYKRLNYKPATTTIFIGDSMTEGFDLRRHLQQDNLVNMGISGDFTSGVLNRLSYATRLQPKQIFVMIGINDILKSVPMERIKKQYAEIINQLKQNAPNTQIYIQSTLPTRDIGGSTQANEYVLTQVVELNTTIAALCRESGVNYIDLHSQFENEKHELKLELTCDGLHLNDEGYAVWSELILIYLKD